MATEKEITELIDLMKKSADHQAISSFNDNYRGMGIVLKTIEEADGFISPGEITSKTCMTGARVAVIIKKLLEKEYITREQDAKDARKVRVSITEKGREFSMKKKKELHSMLSDIVDDVGIDTFYTMFECIEKIHDSTYKIISKCSKDII